MLSPRASSLPLDAKGSETAARVPLRFRALPSPRWVVRALRRSAARDSAEYELSAMIVAQQCGTRVIHELVEPEKTRCGHAVVPGEWGRYEFLKRHLQHGELCQACQSREL